MEMCIGVLPKVEQREEQIRRVQSIELRNLIRRCTQQDPRQRPNAEELITFFEGRINSYSSKRDYFQVSVV